MTFTGMNVKTVRRLSRRNLPMLLLRAREKMMERFRPIVTAHGLTEQQWRVIRVLHKRDGLEPRQISELRTISSPSMTGVLARMEASYLITKERFVDDQRRILVSLTCVSIRLFDVISAESAREYEKLEKDIGRDVVARAHGAIDELLAGLETAGSS